MNLAWLAMLAITQLVCQYAHTLQEDLASFLHPCKKCKQLVELDCQPCFTLLLLAKQNLFTTHGNSNQEKWVKGPQEGTFHSFDFLPVDTLMHLNRSFCLFSTHRTSVPEMLKPEPNTFQNGCELLWSP